MRITNINYNPISIQYKYPVNNTIKSIPFDDVSFGNKEKYSEKYYQAKKYANWMKVFNYFNQGDISSYNIDKLEGIQENLSSFKDLSMQDIAFICRETNAISLVRGCSNQCLHCYVGAEPSSDKSTQYINRMPYEDFDKLMKDFKTLKDRIGVSPFSYKKRSIYLTTFFDSDGMNIVLYDKNGNLHDFTEINDRMYEATGIEQLFDTAGWNPKDPRMQMRAEKYAKYFSNPDNWHKLHQINLSLSPFNPIYVKSRVYGYNPTKYEPSLEEIDNIYTGTPGEKLYKIYINRMANMLFVFSKLTQCPKFGVISRTADENDKMRFFTSEEHQINKINILKNLKMRYTKDLLGEKKLIKNKRIFYCYFNNYCQLLGKDEKYELLVTGRYKELYKQRNSQLEEKDYENRFENIKKSNNTYQNIQDLLIKKASATDTDIDTEIGNNINSRYYKIIDVNGKVYLFDNYKLLPTELQLNLSTNDKQTPKLNVQTQDIIIKKNITRKAI